MTEETEVELPDAFEPEQGTDSEQRHMLLGFAVLVAAIAGVYFLWNYIEPNSVHEPKEPSYIDSIFANPAVIAAARIVLLSLAIVLLFGSIYAAASAVVRMQRRQWLRRAGPFESHLDEAKEELDELDPMLELYGESIQENEELANRLGERDQELEQLATAYGEAVELLQKNGLIQ